MAEDKPMSRALNVHLGALKEPWEAYCAARGLKPGAAIRQAITAQLAVKAPPSAARQVALSQADEQPDKARKEPVRVWLTPSEKTALRKLAEAEECDMARLIVDAVRTRLTGEPQPSPAELQTLGESNFQMLAIGRNLNQIARRLNEGRPVPGITATIKDLRRAIRDHTATVDRAMRACTERWTIE